MKKGRIQAKDIPDAEILAAIRSQRQKSGWCGIYAIHEAAPYPWKVLAAKLHGMTKRGVIGDAGGIHWVVEDHGVTGLGRDFK